MQLSCCEQTGPEQQRAQCHNPNPADKIAVAPQTPIEQIGRRSDQAAGLASSDAVLPAMIDKFAGPLLGAVLLAALLAAVMGTAASVTMLTSITISRDIIGRFKRDMTDKQMLTTQRILMILVAVAGLLVGYFGSSIVSIMEDVGAPSGGFCRHD